MRLPDRFFYDQVTLRDSGEAPRVLIVKADGSSYDRLVQSALRQGVKLVAFPFDPGLDLQTQRTFGDKIVIGAVAARVTGARYWRFKDGEAARAALALAPADYGIHRFQLGSLPAQKGQIPLFETAAAGVSQPPPKYLVRISKEQNLPQIDAKQVIAGEVDPAAIQGMIILVEPPTGPWTQKTVTARDSLGAPITRTEFSAAAIQTLATGKAVTSLSWWPSMLLLLLSALITALAYLRYDPKKIVIAHLVVASLCIFGGAWAALRLGLPLWPVTSLTIVQFLAALIVLYRLELDEEVRLNRFVGRIVNASSQSMLIKEFNRIPRFAGVLGHVLGMRQMLLVEYKPNGKLDILEAYGADANDIVPNRRLQRKLFRATKRHKEAISAQDLVPSWQNNAQITYLGTSEGDLFWVYAFPAESEAPEALHMASTMAQSYRDMMDLRAELSPNAGLSRRYRAIDDFAGSAVELVTQYSEQVLQGLDALETAVIVFHRIGFPLHTNSRMMALYNLAELQLADTSIPELVSAMSGLDHQTISAALKGLLLNGGEIRMPCKDLDPRARIIRIAVPKSSVDHHNTRGDIQKQAGIVVEIIDTTQYQQLTQTRQAVSQFLNTQIRNDLEAITLATQLASDARVPALARQKFFGQLDIAAKRATQRLDDMAKRLPNENSIAEGRPYPLDPSEILREACELAIPMAREYGVIVEADLPTVNGFVIAEATTMLKMIESILQIIIADTPHAEKVTVTLREEIERTSITITGGIGITLERLFDALDPIHGNAPDPYPALASNIASILHWGTMISYTSGVGNGYRFFINMRRVV